MKTLLVALTMMASLESFASNCVVSNIKFERRLGLTGETPIQLAEDKLVRKGYFIDGSSINGLTVILGYYRSEATVDILSAQGRLIGSVSRKIESSDIVEMTLAVLNRLPYCR